MDLEKEIIELKERILKLENLLNIKENDNVESNTQILTRDKTKYIFDGKIMPKNRLVLNIVKAFVKKYNPTYEELQKTFDKSLQGSLGVLILFTQAQEISDGQKRFFMKNDEIITLKDNNKVVVCTQWGAFNINRFILQAQKLGFEIEKILN